MNYIKIFKKRISIVLILFLFLQQTLYANTLLDFGNLVINTLVDASTINNNTLTLGDENISTTTETSFIKQLLLNIVNNIENELLNPALTSEEKTKLLMLKNGFYSIYETCDRSILFSNQYTKEQKQEMLNLLIEQLRKDTKSSLPTSNSKSRNTPTDQIPGIGKPLQPNGYYCIILPHPLGKEYGYGIFFNLEYSSGDIGYFGGNVDTTFYLNGELLESYSDNMGWDIATNKRFGRIYSLSPKVLGNTFNPDSENIVEIKTNILGDYKITLNSPNVEHHTLNNERLAIIRNVSKNAMQHWSYNTPPSTTSSILIIK